jgi:hypothetical protein
VRSLLVVCQTEAYEHTDFHTEDKDSWDSTRESKEWKVKSGSAYQYFKVRPDRDWCWAYGNLKYSNYSHYTNMHSGNASGTYSMASCKKEYPKCEGLCVK